MQYNPSLAAELVTLASIANAKVGSDLPVVKDAIIADLANPKYATEGKWELVWGPTLGTIDDNMLYVAEHSQTKAIAIVLRGTVMKSISSIWEDVPKGQSPFPYGAPNGATVSTSYLHAFEGMLSVADPSGLTLELFLAQRSDDLHGMKVYICGHSQAGGLVAMMLAWVMAISESWRNSGETLIAAYASAGPGSGNPIFADWVTSKGNFFQIVNPLDTIPFWYGEIREVLSRNIPEALGTSLEDDAIRVAVKGWADWSDRFGPWSQPQTAIHLDHVQLPPQVSYIDQAQNQHHHNSYLYLMGAPMIDGLPPSILPKYGPPQPTRTS
ncbi:MAG: hypothetical protein AAF296_06360 [Pseudomonadota bacterium]